MVKNKLRKKIKTHIVRNAKESHMLKKLKNKDRSLILQSHNVCFSEKIKLWDK